MNATEIYDRYILGVKPKAEPPPPHLLTWGSRQSGRSSTQIKYAPLGSIFITLNKISTSQLVKEYRREDLIICSFSEATRKLRGREQSTHIIFDHALWEERDKTPLIKEEMRTIIADCVSSHYIVQSKDECIRLLNTHLNFNDSKY